MNRKSILSVIRSYAAVTIALTALASCAGRGHFITDSGYRAQVESDFANRMEVLGSVKMAGEVNEPASMNEAVCDVYATLDRASDRSEKEALTFLYAYMPLGDIADYEGTLWLDGVRTAFQARNSMPWGRTVPEDVFRHFVLPLRVNNENLDSARTVFYSELKDKVKGLSMYDAVLEVNHWCHEKVTYTASDARTSAPLATMKTAWGRCGEESVFGVAALRAVGIPARQVYTPRWAHTDDNHAWVEVWVDGRWYYLGACEPEPRLNVGWFSSTVLRGMLMHSKVFGRYEGGSEDVIARTDCYTEINVTSNYVPVSRLDVQVLDSARHTVPDARVEFKIYNYAELYSAITTAADEDGTASATFGHGDVVVWASDGDRFGFVKTTVDSTSCFLPVEEPSGLRKLISGFICKDEAPAEREGGVKIILDHKVGEPFSVELDLVPPADRKAGNPVTPEEDAANKILLAEEDSIRAVYTSTFIQDDPIMKRACGNWEDIQRFLFFNSDRRERRQTAEKMLELMNDKDIRDSRWDILNDHTIGFGGCCSMDAPQYEYVLNPRVANEMITPYRSVLKSYFGEGVLNIGEIISVAERVQVMDYMNPQRIPVTPVGVARLGSADARSRDIFFVALCRTYGIPARLDPVDGETQYWQEGNWTDIQLDGAGEAPRPSKGRLQLTYEDNGIVEDPQYEIHFTLSKLDGSYPVLQNFNDNEGLEGTMSYRTMFQWGVTVDSGYYLLTTGTRMASGKVLATLTAFNVPDGNTVRVPLVLRKDSADLQVIGSLDAESEFSLLDTSSEGGSPSSSATTILKTTGRGYFVLCFSRPAHEPTNHALASFLSAEPAVPVIILFDSAADYAKVNWATFPSPPKGVFFGVDDRSDLLETICREMNIEHPQMPLTVIADTFGRIVYVTEGYTIGIAEQLKKL